MQALERPDPAVPSPWGETWLDRTLLAVDATRFFVKWVVIHRGGSALRRPVDEALRWSLTAAAGTRAHT
jgi:hypothetical protein